MPPNKPKINNTKNALHRKNKKIPAPTGLEALTRFPDKIQFLNDRIKELKKSRSSGLPHDHTQQPEDEEIIKKIIISKMLLSQVRSQLVETAKSEAKQQKRQGFHAAIADTDVTGSVARIAFIGLPSVGKSTILAHLTAAKSKVAAYTFTTMTCIPGIVTYKGIPLQLLDLPGIIEGAALGKKQRHILSVARQADLIVLLIDAAQKWKSQYKTLLKELEHAHVIINKPKPRIRFIRKENGGITLTSTVSLTKLSIEQVRIVVKHYKCHHASIHFDEDYGVDDLISIIEENRRFIPCLKVFTRIDLTSIEKIDFLAKESPNNCVLSIHKNLGVDLFLEKCLNMVKFIRVFPKSRGSKPNFDSPVFLRSNSTIEDFIKTTGKWQLSSFRHAHVFGTSCKHYPSQVGLKHVLHNEDVVVIYC